jgi:hypothetical protein
LKSLKRRGTARSSQHTYLFPLFTDGFITQNYFGRILHGAALLDQTVELLLRQSPGIPNLTGVGMTTGKKVATVK